MENEFRIGDLVYLITDKDQLERMVVTVVNTPGETRYHLVCGTDISEHYSIEISKEKNIVKATNG